MPYKSKAQARYFHAKLPELAAEWDSETPNFKKLPEHKSKSKVKRKAQGKKGR